jgi:hypothetical protein
MSFLKGLGKVAGQVAGGVVGGTVKIIGEATNNKFIQEVGDGVYHASVQAGELAGQAASGLVDVASGIIKQDESKLNEGFNDIGNAVGTTARGVGRTLVNVVDNGSHVVNGLIENDNERLKAGAKGLIKTAAVATLAVGVLDIVDGAEHASAEDLPETHTDEVHIVEPHTVSSDESLAAAESNTTNTHHVEPHWRTLADGRTIWVDGDGNPDTHLTSEQGGGFYRSNPDGITSNNLNN